MNDWITAEEIMKLANRRKEFYGEWLVESDEEKHLHELAKAYHAHCDNYDRSVCSGRHPETGEAMPLTPHEMGLVNQNARKTREALVIQGEGMGLTRKQVLQAIRNYY